MYLRVLQDELQFPDDRAIDQDTKSLIRGVWLFIRRRSIDLTFSSSSFNVILHLEYVNPGLRSTHIFR